MEKMNLLLNNLPLHIHGETEEGGKTDHLDVRRRMKLLYRLISAPVVRLAVKTIGS
jgi:hypothetical protein